MLKVAARYGVSSSYMARVCTLLNVPRPERGYWAKLTDATVSPIPPLPDARPGDELVWTRDGEPIKVNRPLPRPPSSSTRRRPKPSTSPPSQHSQTLTLEGRHEYIAALKDLQQVIGAVLVMATQANSEDGDSPQTDLPEEPKPGKNLS